MFESRCCCCLVEFCMSPAGKYRHRDKWVNFFPQLYEGWFAWSRGASDVFVAIATCSPRPILLLPILALLILSCSVWPRTISYPLCLSLSFSFGSLFSLFLFLLIHQAITLKAIVLSLCYIFSPRSPRQPPSSCFRFPEFHTNLLNISLSGILIIADHSFTSILSLKELY